MVPFVAEKGRSFKGAALYYLHDKGARTAERVAFTETHNLHTDDPHLAARMMAYTAMHQSDIKRAAGAAATGRKLSLPVYSYSLSWHPTEEPTREEILQAGHETLKNLDLQDHETIMVAHNDEEHPHLHIIVNRVHPETGLAAKLSNDQLNLSKWAEKYERDRGQIFCHRRAENNERRKDQWVKDRESQHAAEYHRWRSEQSRLAFKQRDTESKNLSDRHKQQHQALVDAKEQRLAKSRDNIREHNRPEWAALYKRQERQRQQFNDKQRTAWGRLRNYIETRDVWDGSGNRTSLRKAITGAVTAVTSGKNADLALDQRQQRKRLAMGERVNRQTRAAIREANTEYTRNRDQLDTQQRKSSAALKKAHSEQSQDLARAAASGELREDFDNLHGRTKPEFDIPDLTRTAPKQTREAKGRGAAADFPRVKDADKRAKRKGTYRAFRDMAEETARDTKADRDQQEKTAKRKGTYRAFRDMAGETTRDTKADRDQQGKTAKRKGTYRAFRDMADDTGRERDADDTGRERRKKPKSPRPPKQGR